MKTIFEVSGDFVCSGPQAAKAIAPAASIHMPAPANRKPGAETNQNVKCAIGARKNISLKASVLSLCF